MSKELNKWIEECVNKLKRLKKVCRKGIREGIVQDFTLDDKSDIIGDVIEFSVEYVEESFSKEIINILDDTHYTKLSLNGAFSIRANLLVKTFDKEREWNYEPVVAWEDDYQHTSVHKSSKGSARYSSAAQMARAYLILREELFCYRNGPSAIDYEKMAETSCYDPNNFSSGGFPMIHHLTEVEYVEALMGKVRGVVGDDKMDAWEALRIHEMSYRDAAVDLGFAATSFSHVRRIVKKVEGVIETILFNDGRLR